MPIPIVSGYVLRVGMKQEVDKDKRQWNDKTQDFDEANKLNTNTTESDKSFEHDCLMWFHVLNIFLSLSKVVVDVLVILLTSLNEWLHIRSSSSA